jgi:hypothetical protein
MWLIEKEIFPHLELAEENYRIVTTSKKAQISRSRASNFL